MIPIVIWPTEVGATEYVKNYEKGNNINLVFRTSKTLTKKVAYLPIGRVIRMRYLRLFC